VWSILFLSKKNQQNNVKIYVHWDLRESLRLLEAVSASADPSPYWADSLEMGASLP
jgi:hypothetical protein